MPVRPDIGDEIEFLDEVPALPVLADDVWDVVDTELDEQVQVSVPSLSEQRTSRRYLRELAADVRGEAA